MDEALFAQLADWLRREAVVVASVSATRGATPRKRGSRMLVSGSTTAFSIGGGLAEARTIAAARALLQAGTNATEWLDIDLGGGTGSAGVCGGYMRLRLQRWAGAADLALATDYAARLAAGETVALPAAPDEAPLLPDPRLLVVGAGHCGAALCIAAGLLGYDLAVFDTRAGLLTDAAFATALRLHGDYAALATALDTPRPVQAVLLNRDFVADVASLRVLCAAPRTPIFLGMMGSQRRIRQVVAALPEHAATLAALQAPVGLDIGAETPQEIAVSILAQLIAARRGAA